MTPALTPAELAAMTARAESAAGSVSVDDVDHCIYCGLSPYEYGDNYQQVLALNCCQTQVIHQERDALAADVLSLAALYTASQAALTGALAELTAARAELEEVNTIYRATKKIISSTPCGDVVHDQLYEMGLLGQDE